MTSNGRVGLTTLLASTGSALLSALVTAVMLLINGSFVSVLLSAFASSGPEWLARPGVLQFILFVAPLMMVVVEWMILDTVADLFVRRHRT